MEDAVKKTIMDRLNDGNESLLPVFNNSIFISCIQYYTFKMLVRLFYFILFYCDQRAMPFYTDFYYM